jgi:hypothetical protein
VKHIKTYKLLKTGKNMKKLLGLAGIVLAATAGCTSFNYGVKDTLYLMGPHGEPSPVLRSDSPQPRSMMFETYNTENGDVLTVRDYQGYRVGSCKPTISLFKYIDMPDGTKVLTPERVKIGIHSELFSEQANKSYEPPILPTQETPIPAPPKRSSGIALPPPSK